ncbi:hypothetical protein [Kiloniella litopenaei]|uniref:hypothetical protein n=1 Tax=Kiloniella litopenaei TaxID=1549748 RepID=UPI003BAA8BFE
MTNEIIDIDNESNSSASDVSIGGETGTKHNVSMQIVQDIYNQITDKNEEISKGIDSPYQVNIEDLKQLNQKVIQMLEQYHVKACNCSVTVYHEKSQKQLYSSFDRFELYDKSITTATESVLVTYHVLIVPPISKRVQSYTLSIRIGSKITILKEVSNNGTLPPAILKFISGNHAKITVEYIDYTIARNFMDTIDSWFKSLDTDQHSKVVKFIHKYSHFIPTTLKYSSLALSGYLLLEYASNIIPTDSTNLNLLFISLCCTFGLTFIVYSIFVSIGKYIEGNLYSISEISYVNLNKGDDRAITKAKKNNKRDTIKSIVSVVGALSLGILSSVIANLVIP